ncbi:hypothetical protein Tco_1501404 [Tanacetum coccineum]
MKQDVDTNPRYKTDNATGPVWESEAVNAFGDRKRRWFQNATIWDTVIYTARIMVIMLRNAKAKKNWLEDSNHEQSDWLSDMIRKIDEQELEAHYSYMAKIQEVPNADSGTDAEPLEQLDVDDNKKIQKQLKKANATLTQELTECKSILAETSRTLGESNIDYDQLERKLNETLGLLAQKDIDIQEGLKVKAYEISVVQAKHDELVKHSLLTKSHYEGLVKRKQSKEIYTELLQRFARLEKHSISLEIALQECQVQLKNDTVCKERASNVFRKEREQYVEIQDLKAQLQDKNMAISELKKLVEKCKGKSVDTKFDKPSVA